MDDDPNESEQCGRYAYMHQALVSPSLTVMDISHLYTVDAESIIPNSPYPTLHKGDAGDFIFTSEKNQTRARTKHWW